MLFRISFSIAERWFAKKYPAHWLNWLKSQLFHFSFLRSIVVGHLAVQATSMPKRLWNLRAVFYSFLLSQSWWSWPSEKAWPSEKVPSAKPFLHAVEALQALPTKFFQLPVNKMRRTGDVFFLSKEFMTHHDSGFVWMAKNEATRYLSIAICYFDSDILVSQCFLDCFSL